jgi:hypothetical protein
MTARNPKTSTRKAEWNKPNAKRAKVAKARAAAFDALTSKMTAEVAKGFHKPGSMNAHNQR